MQRIQQLRWGQRLLVFILIFGGGLLLILAVAAFLILQTLNSGSGESSRAIQAEPVLLPLNAEEERQPVTITGREYAVLEDDDAHPSALALADDGTLYIGSFHTGTIWAVTPQSQISELSGTREQIGSVTGLEVARDGTLYVADRRDSNPRAGGGTVWRIRDGEIIDLGAIGPGFQAPSHLALDDAGNLYVVDRGYSEIWRYTPDGTSSLLWYIPPDVLGAEQMILTGIAFDPSTSSLIATDSELSAVFRVSLDGESSELLYRYAGPENDAPNFNGVAVSGDGTIFLAALNSRRLAVLLDGELFYLAENFRQISDVAVSADGRQIYATNMDARSLIIPGIKPQRPFTVDEFTLTVGE